MQPNLTLDIFKADEPHVLLKNIIKQYCIELFQQFDPHQPVNRLITAKTDLIDEILKLSATHFLKDLTRHLALIAIGGYGRRELFPHSDIDFLVLVDADHADVDQGKLSGFLNFLWDIGLKPGYSVRTIEQCMQAAIDDQTIITSLLELRLICGNHNLFETLREQISTDQIWPSEQFFNAKVKEQEQRYIKFHDTAYNLEPNIKEGPGGLRDMQVIAWVFKRHYHSATLKELIKYGFMPESEYNELMSAQQKLWQLRYALHVITGRNENRLLFDYQRELASWFGYTECSNNQDIEQFMCDYFKIAVELQRLNEMLLQLFRERFIDVSVEQRNPTPINSKFDAINGYIEAKHENIFKEHPLALLEIFMLLQQIFPLKGIRATTIRLIRKSLPLIDENFRQNINSRRLFMAILRQPRGITHVLRRMNRYGILAAYLPSFAHIVARMQYDLFHIYTVDEHTLFVVRNLRRFTLTKHHQELPFCNDIFLLIGGPEVLYIAALFHDIAKGKGGDHSVMGENIAQEFCVQHELSQHDTKLVTWLVRNHLLMSMTAQRKDISDPEVIHEFAEIVGSTEYLNYLYLLTVADIRATNPELWNSWKDSLLKELYTATQHALRRGLHNPIDHQDRINETKTESRRELIKLGNANATIDLAWNHTNDEYFLRYYPDEIVWHTLAIASSRETELPLVLLRPQNQRGSAEIFIYTQNADFIFSLSTAILDRLGLNILNARIVTTHTGYVLNSFQILEQSGNPINDLHREIHICDSLRKHLISKNIVDIQNYHRQSRQAKHFPITTRVIFHNDAHSHHTTLELITTDRAGLLSKVSKAFRKQKIKLYSARIATIGSRVEDIFYISDIQSKPIKDSEQQQRLEAEILNILK